MEIKKEAGLGRGPQVDRRELEQMDFTHCFVGHGAPMPREQLFAWFGERLGS